MLRALAWLGGVLFVASVASFIYFYIVVLERTADTAASAIRNALFNTMLFLLFAFHHSLLARTGIKKRVSAWLPQSAERTVYVWFASVLLLLTCALWRPLPGEWYNVEGPLRWAFHACQLLGVLLTWRGAAVLDPLELAGVRQARGEVTTPTFRVLGPFRLVRHPIYLGWLLMMFGSPTMTSTRLLFAVVSSAYLLIAIPWEEKSLVEAFGDPYRAYQQQVRWRILPGVW